MIIVTGPGSQSVDLNSYYMETCETVPSETNAYIPKMVSNSWLSVSDSGYSNDQRLFKITAAPNDSQETRKSIVLFNRGNTTYRVTVSQEKQAFQDFLAGPSAETGMRRPRHCERKGPIRQDGKDERSEVPAGADRWIACWQSRHKGN